MDIKRNLWHEWWIHFRTYYKDVVEVWKLGQQHGLKQPFIDFVEEIREGWFKEIQK